MLRILKNTGLEYSRTEVLLGDFFLVLILCSIAFAKFSHLPQERGLMMGMALMMVAGCSFIYILLRPWLTWPK